MSKRIRASVLLAALTASAGLAAPAGAVPPGPNGEPPRPSTATGATVPAPAVTGPVAHTSPVGDPAHGYPFLATDVDLAKAGYVEEEYLISGQANRYTITGTNTATVLSSGHPYSTRIVVRRPASRREVQRHRDRRVDQRQQPVGPGGRLVPDARAPAPARATPGSASPRSAWACTRATGLRAVEPDALRRARRHRRQHDQRRLAVLRHLLPGGEGGPQPGGPRSARLAGRAGVRDRHRVTRSRRDACARTPTRSSRCRTSSTRSCCTAAAARCAPTPRCRSSASTPRATSPAASATAPARADSPTFRNWEVAGASHGDWKLITDYGPLRKRDIGTYPGGYPGEPQTCTLPSLSRVPQHMVQNALYDHTFKWVAYGIAPPSAPGDHHDDAHGQHGRA